MRSARCELGLDALEWLNAEVTEPRLDVERSAAMLRRHADMWAALDEILDQARTSGAPTTDDAR